MALGEWFRDHSTDKTYMNLLAGRVQTLLLVYESTPMRMGFTAAMAQLGGFTACLTAKETQMRRALNEFIDVFAGRLWSQDDMETAAQNMTCPVLHACTPVDHSTHAIGELMTIKQAKGKLEGLNLVYTGMARGILHSLIRVCPMLGINLRLAIPESYARTVNQEILAEGQAKTKEAITEVEIVTDLMRAVEGVDFIQASTLIRSMLAGASNRRRRKRSIPPNGTVTE